MINSISGVKNNDKKYLNCVHGGKVRRLRTGLKEDFLMNNPKVQKQGKRFFRQIYIIMQEQDIWQ